LKLKHKIVIVVVCDADGGVVLVVGTNVTFAIMGTFSGMVLPDDAAVVVVDNMLNLQWRSSRRRC
jgi:hypothetical protein